VISKYKHRYYVNAKTTANSGLVSNQNSTSNIHLPVAASTTKAKYPVNEYTHKHTQAHTPAEFFNFDSNKSVKKSEGRQRISEPPGNSRIWQAPENTDNKNYKVVSVSSSKFQLIL